MLFFTTTRPTTFPPHTERHAGGDSDDEGGSDDDAAAAVGENIALPEGRVGKKKLAKLQAKADKRVMREVRRRRIKRGVDSNVILRRL